MKPRRGQCGARASLSMLVAVLTLCLGLAAAAAPAAQDAAPRPSLSETEKARLVLDRLGFGARPGEVERVASMGVSAWIERQLHPEAIPDVALAEHLQGLALPNETAAELFAQYPSPGLVRRRMMRNGDDGQDVAEAGDEDALQDTRRAIRDYYRDNGYGRPQEIYLQLAADRLLRATYSERQLQEVMVDFWSNHFNVYARKNVLAWYLPEFDREVIRPHALGNFRDLLLATAQSPAMLFYLDNYQSVSPDAADRGVESIERLAAMPDERLVSLLMQRRGLDQQQAMERVRRFREDPQALLQRRPGGLNENYARELMELHTLGVDGGYTQQDVHEVARAFTGWTIADPRGAGAMRDGGMGNDGMGNDSMGPGGWQQSRGETGTFYFNPRMHDAGVKTVLGKRIDAGGVGDGLAVIDLLATHPATARFIAYKLAQKFVADDPPQALVERVAAAFTRSDGDIRSTLRALFNDPAFFAPRYYRSKVRTPFELVAAGLRALQADTNGREIQAFLFDLGQPLYGQQTPNGYAEAAADWVNSGALLKRMNFAVALAANRIPGTHVDLARLDGADGGASPGALLDVGLQRWLDEATTPATRDTMQALLAQPLPEATAPEQMQPEAGMQPATRGAGRGVARRMRLQPSSGDPEHIRIAALILGSPDFQRQ